MAHYCNDRQFNGGGDGLDNYKQKWEHFLDPENLSISLRFLSLFIAIYENFKSTIIEHVKYFYWSGIKDGVELFDDYEKMVLSKVQSKENRQIKATLLWLKEEGAITEQDRLLFIKLTDKRNEFTHNMSTLIFEGLEISVIDLLTDMITLYEKIEKWWIKEIEIPTNPELTPEQYDTIDWDEIESMNIVMLKIMADIAINNNAEYLKIFKSQTNTSI